MKVDHIRIVDRIYRPSERVHAKHIGSSRALSDTLSLSHSSVLGSELYKKVLSQSNIRHDLVEAIRARIEDGTYAVSARQIAEAMLKEDAGL